MNLNALIDSFNRISFEWFVFILQLTSIQWKRQHYCQPLVTWQRWEIRRIEAVSSNFNLHRSPIVCPFCWFACIFYVPFACRRENGQNNISIHHVKCIIAKNQWMLLLLIEFGWSTFEQINNKTTKTETTKMKNGNQIRLLFNAWKWVK